jgi:hypothetical protein
LEFFTSVDGVEEGFDGGGLIAHWGHGGEEFELVRHGGIVVRRK